MASLNEVKLIGRLGRDIELKYSNSGTAIAQLSIATNRRVKNGDEWVNETDWHRAVLFGKTAEFAEQYAKKGSQVYLAGRLQTRQYDKDGQTHYVTEIVATDFQLLGSRDENNASASKSSGFESAPRSANRPQTAARQNSYKESAESFDEDIPF